MTPAQQDALDTPEIQRTSEEFRLASEAMSILEITPQDLAERIAQEAPQKAKDARELAIKIDQVSAEAQYTRNYRQTANYDYWKTRSEFEQTDDALTARESIYDAKRAYENGDLFEARRLYETGLAHWRKILDRYPSMIENTVLGSELLEEIKEYRKVLDQIGENLPDDFPLWDIIRKYDSGDFRQELAAHDAAAQGTPEEGTDNAAADEADAADDGAGETASSEGASAEEPEQTHTEPQQ